MAPTTLLTGATGLVGGALLHVLLGDPARRVFVLGSPGRSDAGLALERQNNRADR